MKSGGTDLYASPQTGDRVTAYAHAHSSPLPAHLTAYHARAAAARSDAEMLSSNFQSQLHLLLARSIGAKRVLEVGVYVGYSAMLWAHAVGPDGRVTGLEHSPELAAVAVAALAEHGVANADIVVGDAAETLLSLPTAEPYDLAFLDADKTGYSNYLSVLLARSPPGGSARLLRPGALIIADNVLRGGHVADSSLPPPQRAAAWDAHIAAVRRFNDECCAEPRLDVFVVPLWDGVSVMRLRD